MKTVVVCAAVLAAASATNTDDLPGWVYLAASLVTSGVAFQLLSWRMNRRVAAAGAERAQAEAERAEAEAENITAEVYGKLRRHVREQLAEMEQAVRAAAAGQAEAQARLATAQAELATALARASEDRRSLHLQLQEAEERHARVLAEYRSHVGKLERRIDELEGELARSGHTERRRRGRRRDDDDT